MSLLVIQQYYKKLENLIQYGDSRNEQSIRLAFLNLLESYCEPRHFTAVPELDYCTKSKTIVRPDATIKNALRIAWGFWEAKDSLDDLDKEIQQKFAKGYPDDNTLFEDSYTAVLIQDGKEVLRINMQNAEKLNKLLNQFLDYEPSEVRNFREAITKFRTDLPTIVDTLRSMLTQQAETNQNFREAFDSLFKLCQKSINPKINDFDIKAMIIQHILTEDIFLHIFNDSQFHKENIVSKQLDSVVDTFFVGNLKRNTLKSIESYYAVIRREAASIANHHEKQKFLKIVYENFYKTYNPKSADRLGIVYTPNEIVCLMIESVDFLLDKYFNRLLADKDVEILDPATGTGTFITELIEYLPKHALPFKYQHEIHCNEVAILPYYIANLNIEYTYQQKMGNYQEFTHICFVDTLDNLGFSHEYKNQQKNLGFGKENAERIAAQNTRKISVIIGNPPYNANQQNENDNNKNREYPEIDEAIKLTYIANSTAQKTKLYDMYTRFFRWASNRLNDNGIVAFITNNSFVNARSYDGFRKMIIQEFSEIYIIDLGGNIRMRDKANVFNIKVGVAVSFMVRRQGVDSCKIYYTRIPEFKTREEKLGFLRDLKIKDIDFKRIIPDKDNNWIDLADTDFEELLPLANKKTKLAKNQADEEAVFKLFSFGISTNRDDWVYDFSQTNLVNKMRFFIERYNEFLKNGDDSWNISIKWSRDLKNKFRQKRTTVFDEKLLNTVMYRPFVKRFLYTEKLLIDRLTQNHYDVSGKELDKNNIFLTIHNHNELPSFTLLLSKTIPDAGLSGRASPVFSLYHYDSKGNRLDNITDWGLMQFQNFYQNQSITKLDIFHYVYAVLHNPVYRRKYALNLKRDFPRLPFYTDFFQWVEWGNSLMNLHLYYETAEKYPLIRVDLPLKIGINKVKLKADKIAGKIMVDSETILSNIPQESWQYTLGNRSALEWILDQYKEKKIKDKTIAEKFNTYRFADYKEYVIDLLQRICTVSVKTIEIIKEMEKSL